MEINYYLVAVVLKFVDLKTENLPIEFLIAINFFVQPANNLIVFFLVGLFNLNCKLVHRGN